MPVENIMNTRDRVTYERVADTANKLQEQGITPIIRNIREAIGGSPNTILKHLTAWREANTKRFSPELSANIVKMLTSEISKIVADACTGAELLALQYKKESIQLAAAGETLEIENKDFLRKITELTAERERLAGKAEEQEITIQKLSRKLDSEIRICEQMRVATQSLKAEITLLCEKMAERDKNVEVLAKELEEEKEARATLEQTNATLLAKLKAKDGAVTTSKQRPNKKDPTNA